MHYEPQRRVELQLSACTLGPLLTTTAASLAPWHVLTSRRTQYFCYKECGHEDQLVYLCPWMSSTWGKTCVLLDKVLKQFKCITSRKNPSWSGRKSSWTLFIWMMDLCRSRYWDDAADLWQSTKWTSLEKSVLTSLSHHYSLSRPYFLGNHSACVSAFPDLNSCRLHISFRVKIWDTVAHELLWRHWSHIPHF